jgi:hypothetical protein
MHQGVVLDILETTFDVSFDEPLGSFPCLMDIDKGRVASLFWSESVAVSRELWFVIGFQDGAYDVLHHFWRPVWHAEWSFSAFGFVYIDSP